MGPARYPARSLPGRNGLVFGGREVERLEKELAESRARERKARHELEETKERFGRLLDASKSFAHTLSSGRQQQRQSRRYLAVQHAVDRALVEADSLEDAAGDVLKTLAENLGWQAAAMWVAGEEVLRCVEVWHRTDALLEGFARARLRTSLAPGERLPGRALATNRPVWESTGEARDPTAVPGGALAFPIAESGGASGAIELLGGEFEVPEEELLYIARLVGSRLGQFAERHRSMAELREAEERLRLTTEAGHVGLFDWDLRTDKSRYFGAMAEIYGYPQGQLNPSYEVFLQRVHPDDRERVRRTLDDAIAAGEQHELEFRIVRPSGEVRWVRSKGRVYADERGAPARVVGLALDLTEHKRSEQERDRLHSLEASAQAEATERERISRELHDRVAHTMGVAHQSLQLYEALVEKDPERAHARLRTAQEMIRTALEQTRNLSSELRRSETEDGLVKALRDLLEFSVPDDIGADLSASGEESLLSDHQRGQLYLILREAVRNAVRHSGCRRLAVGVDITPEEVSGYVEDDGRGFGENGNGEVGLGLRSIKERAALLNGTARVYSSPQGGAGVRVFLPLRDGGGVGWRTRR